MIKINSTKPYKGFSLVEALILMVILSVIIAASLPVMTKMSGLKTGIDKNSMDCITNGVPNIYNSNGSTNIPALGSTCYAAVKGCQYNSGKACDTVIWQADNGSIAAKKILRAACDQGGEKACDWFIKQCLKNGSSTSPYCDLYDGSTDNYLDISYYLKNLPASNTTNVGRQYLADEVSKLVDSNVQILINETFNDCKSSSSSTACGIPSPINYITKCNSGDSFACQYSYNNNYNKTCTQIKDTYAAAGQTATSGNYNITIIDGPSGYRSVYCNMPSGLMSSSILLKTAAFTGKYETWTTPATGTYKIEAWGAQGATGGGTSRMGSGAYGGYSYGDITLNSNTVLYLYTGGQNGWNGGGSGGNGSNVGTYNGGNGGGASDIRKLSGNWNDSASLNSRILVAAGGGGGGGGGNYGNSGSGGYGGGTTGTNGSCGSNCYNYATGGTGNSGGSGSYGCHSTSCCGCSWGSTSGGSGSLGTGGIGDYSCSSSYQAGGGGGGGYYGGGGGGGCGSGNGGAGGSSYTGQMSANTGTSTGIQSGNGLIKIWLK